MYLRESYNIQETNNDFLTIMLFTFLIITIILLYEVIDIYNNKPKTT
jgi:hypothetical protein